VTAVRNRLSRLRPGPWAKPACAASLVLFWVTWIAGVTRYGVLDGKRVPSWVAAVLVLSLVTWTGLGALLAVKGRRAPGRHE
jgi:hypothetical protein